MYREKLKERWKLFAEKGIVSPEVPKLVAESWEKCRKHGLDPNENYGVGKFTDDILFQNIIEANKQLIDVALPIMDSACEILKQSNFLLVLTDGLGYILKSVGDDKVKEMAKKVRFVESALWSELEVGTNAIGIALSYGVPIQTAGAEHFYATQHDWICSASPIRGLNGDIIGSINISGPLESVQPHTLALVVSVAFSIESMIAGAYNSHLTQVAMDGSNESIILIDEKLQPIRLNQRAKKMIGVEKDGYSNLNFKDVMPDINWNEIFDSEDKKLIFTTDTRVICAGDVTHCSASVSVSTEYGLRVCTVNLKKQEQLIKSVNKLSGNTAVYTFESILTKSENMREIVALAKKYARYDGSVLIEGESGTGKELFAQAIHNESSRKEGPFVAVNCASLPRELIESELFGYERGAFTGALKEGNPGKFELANRGTLFLDEIGEMPMEFQAKLLRAVETLQVRRVGGTEERKLDVRVIVATNRNLRIEAKEGRFREDLYYRLNVLSMRIPPLRERRDDIEYCAEIFFEKFGERYPEQRKRMSGEYVEKLLVYDWPGNVRELQNSIERTFYASNKSILIAEDFSYVMGGEHTEKTEKGKQESEYNEIVDAISKALGNANEAAEILGISRATFYRKCTKYGIEPKKEKKSQKSQMNEKSIR